jgi:hypothetical protein
VTELTTGWGADRPVADSLRRQFVHAYAYAYAALAFYPPERAFVALSVFPVPGEAFAGRGLAHMGHPPRMVLPWLMRVAMYFRGTG